MLKQGINRPSISAFHLLICLLKSRRMHAFHLIAAIVKYKFRISMVDELDVPQIFSNLDL